MITFELSCACGAVLSYEGDRRGEREAKEAWNAAHGNHAAAAEAPAPEPEPEPATPARGAGGRFQPRG